MASVQATIIGTLVGAGAFAAALGAYLYHAIPSREELLADNALSPRASAGFAYAEELDARVKAIAAAFVTALAEERDADAYGLMAAPYRAVANAAAFTKSCRASPFLAGARSVAISTVRETIAPGANAKTGAISASGVLTSAAGAVPIRLTFLDEGARLAVVSVVVADAPVVSTTR